MKRRLLGSGAGFGIPLLTILLAFAIGGLVVLVRGTNPLTIYRALWVGAGFDWPFQFLPGNPIGVNGQLSELYLISTLVVFTPLVMTSLAVAFAFRAGLFNIGGQGQFWVGTVLALVTTLAVGGVPGMILGTLAGIVGGAAFGALAGALKAFRGAHEVITTIMLNWLAIFGSQYIYSGGGLLSDPKTPNGISKQVPASAHYPQIWGNVQGVHVGIFVALAAAVMVWVVLEKTTLGYEIRAVGLNPEAARYAGISVRRSMIVAMAISGGLAGLAGANELLGVHYSVGISDVQGVDLAFTGIAVALVGRNTPLGCVLGALLFAFLASGARNLSGAFSPELARGLAQIIQGAIIVLVGGEYVVRWLLGRARRRPPVDPELPLEAAT